MKMRNLLVLWTLIAMPVLAFDPVFVELPGKSIWIQNKVELKFLPGPFGSLAEVGPDPYGPYPLILPLHPGYPDDYYVIQVIPKSVILGIVIRCNTGKLYERYAIPIDPGECAEFYWSPPAETTVIEFKIFDFQGECLGVFHYQTTCYQFAK